MIYEDLTWEFDGQDYEDLVLNHPVMEPQRHHKQLGQIEAIFSGATHTRYAHAGYAKKIAKEICKILKEKGRLPCAENDIVQATALHDMGHPPFSHAVEYVLKEFDNGKTHHERALELLDSDIKDTKERTIRDVLEIYDADVDNVRRLLSGADQKKGGNPASRIFTDKTFGADKLAYTLMDAIRCGFYTTPPNWKRTINFLTFFKDNLGLDINLPFSQLERQIDISTDTQDTYFRLYTGLYLSELSLAYERHIQKAVEFAHRAGIITAKNVWSMGDSTLVKEIMSSESKDQFVEKAKEALRGFTAKQPFTAAVSFKFKEFELDKFSDEEIAPIEEEYAAQFTKTFGNPLRLTVLESELEEKLKIPVLVSVLPDPEKVIPGEVYLYQNGTFKGTLRNLMPAHYRHLEEQAAKSFAVRILVPQSEKQNTARRFKEVADCFFEASKKYMTRPDNLQVTA